MDQSSNMPANAVRIDGMIRENVGAGIEDLIDLRKKSETKVCETMLVAPTDPNQAPAQ